VRRVRGEAVTTLVECSEYRDLAGDPAILKDGNVYRIFTTGLDKVIEGGLLRLWYLTSDGDIHRTGYTEIPWPIDWGNM